MGSPACGSFQFYDGGGFFASLHESGNACTPRRSRWFFKILTDCYRWGAIPASQPGATMSAFACTRWTGVSLYVALIELHAELRTRRLADHDFRLATRSSSNSSVHRNSDAWWEKPLEVNYTQEHQDQNDRQRDAK